MDSIKITPFFSYLSIFSNWEAFNSDTLALSSTTMKSLQEKLLFFSLISMLLAAASARNQNRHHTGFHYPRSFDTMMEIVAARADFEAEYGEAIDRRAPAYYCTSSSGVEIPAGSIVMALNGAANRDPRVFEGGDRFDPQRRGARRNIAFGHGEHFCPGASLARAEALLVPW